MKTPIHQFDYLILGSGIAGLSFALKVAPHGRVAILTKKDRAESNTNYAQGGIAAVTSKKIRILAYTFIASGTVNVKFQSDGGGTPVDKSGLKYCVANVGIVAPFSPVGWLESDVGKSLDLNLSAAIAIGGEMTYVEV